jgi:hypothetical protein
MIFLNSYAQCLHQGLSNYTTLNRWKTGDTPFSQQKFYRQILPKCCERTSSVTWVSAMHQFHCFDIKMHQCRSGSRVERKSANWIIEVFCNTWRHATGCPVPYTVLYGKKLLEIGNNPVRILFPRVN